MKKIFRTVSAAVTVCILIAASVLFAACDNKPTPEKVIDVFTKNGYTIFDYWKESANMEISVYETEVEIITDLTNRGIRKKNEEQLADDPTNIPQTEITEEEVRQLHLIICFKGETEEDYDFYYICFADSREQFIVFRKIVEYSGQFSTITKKNQGVISYNDDDEGGFAIYSSKDALELLPL